MTSWVYKQSEPALWTVGFYKPDGTFEPESDHDSAEDAAQRVNYLNGGKGEEYVNQIFAARAGGHPR